jgi:hypothetical protein
MKTCVTHCNAKEFTMNVLERMIELYTFLCFSQISQTVVVNGFRKSESKMAA